MNNPVVNVAEPSGASAEVLAAADELLIPTYSPLPIVPDRGVGSLIYDIDGRDYIDFGAGIAVTAVGHSNPVVLEALTDQAAKLWHLSNIFTNEPAMRLARQLTDATFADRVFFANSGGEANEAAFKLARHYFYDQGDTDRYELISLEGSFHGRTWFTVSVAANPKYKEGFGPAIGGISHVAPNDIDALRAAVSSKTAAVVMEPIQGEGGVRPLHVDYVQAARQICDDNGALLIFDEVQSGVGRTGTAFAYEQFDITPDVLTSAKGLGGGFPVAATLAREPYAQGLGKATHGSTYGGNPLACAVASAVFAEATKPETLANVNERHTQITDTLNALAADTGVFSEVRGMGLLIGAEMADAYRDRAKEIQLAALDQGVITLIASPNVVRIAPALTIDADVCAEGLRRLSIAVRAMAD